MRLSYQQILSDEKEMTDYICERLTEKKLTKLVLAAGEDGETWVELWGEWDDATGWTLSMETSDEEVDLEDVYDHLRRKEMTHREWWREFDRQIDRSKVFHLEDEVRKLREEQDPSAPSDSSPFASLAEFAEKTVALLEDRAKSVVGSISPEVLSKEDAARFLGIDVPAVEHLIRTRRLQYVQLGSQRGRVIPVESLRKIIKDNLQLTGEELRRKRSRP